jgi:DNA-binding XRE family transcriptional regulator
MAKNMSTLAARTMSNAARAKAQQRAQDIMAEMLLSELRKSTGATQKQVAARLGIAQPTLARLEKQDDMQLTTLRRMVEALGGELEIVARFPSGKVKIREITGS